MDTNTANLDAKEKKNLKQEMSKFIDSKYRKLNNNKKYGFTTPSEYIELHMKRACLGDKVAKLKQLNKELKQQNMANSKEQTQRLSGTGGPMTSEGSASYQDAVQADELPSSMIPASKIPVSE